MVVFILQVVRTSYTQRIKSFSHIHVYIYNFVLSAVCKKPCQNGGSCDGWNRCKCSAGYRGRWCHKKVKRRRCPGKCLNGGKCRRNRCRCKSGFSGARCEKRYDIMSYLLLILLLERYCFFCLFNSTNNFAFIVKHFWVGAYAFESDNCTNILLSWVVLFVNISHAFGKMINRHIFYSFQFQKIDMIGIFWYSLRKTRLFKYIENFITKKLKVFR